MSVEKACAAGMIEGSAIRGACCARPGRASRVILRAGGKVHTSCKFIRIRVSQIISLSLSLHPPRPPCSLARSLWAGRLMATGLDNRTEHVWYSLQLPREKGCNTPVTSVVFFGGDCELVCVKVQCLFDGAEHKQTLNRCHKQTPYPCF